MLTQGPAPDYRRIFILRLHLALGVHAVIVVNGEGISLIGSLLIGLVHMLLVFLVKNLFFVFLFFAFLFCFFYWYLIYFSFSSVSPVAPTWFVIKCSLFFFFYLS